MARKVRLKASVGRQRITALTPGNQTAYIRSIRDQFKRIVENYEDMIEQVEDQSTELLLDALKPTFELSQKYVPVDTQDLKNSGFLEIDKSSKNPRVIIGYAKGGDPYYAVFVHEMVNLTHEAPTRAKFLLAALEEEEAAIQQRIVKGYKQMVGE